MLSRSFLIAATTLVAATPTVAAAADMHRLGISTFFTVYVPPPPVNGTAVNHAVPFTSQAPDGDWSEPKFADGCEEASILMAARWRTGSHISVDDAKSKILALSGEGEMAFGSFVDSSAADTFALYRAHFGEAGLTLRYDVTGKDLREELRSGAVLIVPVNGQALNNPHYVGSGPARHTLVVRGYDPVRDVYVTNDPGTSRGEAYSYPASVLEGALRDYATGNHVALPPMRTAAIVVRR